MDKITAVIQAGGLGTRMRELTKDEIPKPMLLLNGKPLLQWQIEHLVQYGIRDIVIIIGHLGEKIKEYFGDGHAYGVNIDYIEEREPLGSAGSLFYLNKLNADRYIIIYGDVMFDIDIDRWLAFHIKNEALITTVCHPNSHPADSDLVMTDDSNRITNYLWKSEKRDSWFPNLGNAGLYILEQSVLQQLTGPTKIDLEKDIIDEHIASGKVFAYRTSEYIKDAGTPDRFRKVCEDQIKGIWTKRNLSQKQRCIFLDRDGTINHLNGLVSKEDEFELEERAAEAIGLINTSGYLCILITNQPAVARGMCGIDDIKRIHWKMETILGRDGVYLDDIAFCPHHPDRGYPEENPDYKIDCSCRKPKTGMIDAMAEKYNIDLSKSYMIGDTTVDIQTGINAGTKTVLLHTGEAGKDHKYDVQPDFEAEDLLDAVKRIIKEEQ